MAQLIKFTPCALTHEVMFKKRDEAPPGNSFSRPLICLAVMTGSHGDGGAVNQSIQPVVLAYGEGVPLNCWTGISLKDYKISLQLIEAAKAA